MSPATGLLVLTRPAASIVASLPRVLSAASKQVGRTLYVHLDPLAQTKIPDTTRPLTLYSHIVSSVYARSPSLCRGLEVRVLLAGFKGPVPHPPKTQRPIDVLILEGVTGEARVEVEGRYRGCLTSGGDVVVIEECEGDVETSEGSGGVSLPSPLPTDKVYPSVVVGGTFDRPHAGHLVFLSTALMRCSDKLTCGVADGPLLKKKTLTELIKPIEERMAGVVELVGELDPTIDCRVYAIEEPLGPTRWEPDMDMIVVSEETKRGVEAINKVRKENDLRLLEGHIVPLVEDEIRESSEEEAKVSSSSMRMRLLGTVLQEPLPNPSIPSRPYVIGLTGGSATGKSSVAKRIAKLGAAVIDCDKVGHEAYLPGTACHEALVKTFGVDIVGEDGHINRPALAAKVFGDEKARTSLNEIVWPEIQRLVEKKVSQLASEGVKVVVLDAAVLLEAGWERRCHQVWVCIVKREEAVRRIVERDGKTQEEAERRLDSQMSTTERIERANLVFCTQWSGEYTQKQVERAWATLSARLVEAGSGSEKSVDNAVSGGGDEDGMISPPPKSRV